MRERKDATFQTAYEPQRVPTGEHNAQISDLLPHPADQPFEFSKDAEMDACRQGGPGVRAQEHRCVRGIDQR